MIEAWLHFIIKNSKFCLQKGLLPVKMATFNVSAKMHEHSGAVFTKRAVIGILTEARDGV